MKRKSANPHDQIRSADHAVEQGGRNTLDGALQREARDSGARYHHCRMPGVDRLSQPVAADLEHQREAPAVPQPLNPIVVMADADHNVVPGIDVLEALIYLADPEAMCRQIAEQALQVFGSVGAVLSARVSDLTRNLGIRQDIAYALKAIHTGMRAVLKEPIRERIPIGSLDKLVEYLGVSLRYEPIEVLRILYLDRSNGLMSDEEAYRGTVNHVPIYPREIVRRALEIGASAVIVVHNYPSDDPTPSNGEVSFSQQVAGALSVMNIPLHDYLIIGRNGFASLRSRKHF